MIKHSSSFTHSDFTPDLTSLSALHNMAAEHFLSLERWLLRKHVRRQGSASRHMVQLRRFLGLNS